MIFGILILAFLLRIYNLNQSFWLDEAAQVIESTRSFTEQFQLAADFHPPLYHLILFFWMKFGTSEIWVRLLSVLFGLGSIFSIYKIGSFLGNKKVGLITSFFLAISPYHIWYSQEARPYMLFVFISLVSTYLLLRRNWLMYTISISLSLYSLYFAPFLILGHLVYIIYFHKNELINFIKRIMIAFLVLIPWMPSFVNQLKVGTGGFFSGWTDVVSFSPIKSIPLTFAKFVLGHGSFDNKILYGSIVAAVILLFVYCCIRMWKIKEGKILLIIFFIPFIGSVATSFFIPILAPQRLLFLLPVFYLILAFGIEKSSRKIQTIGFILLMLISISGIIQYYVSPYVQREKWREAVEFAEKNKDPKSVSLFVFPDPFAPYLWYRKNRIDAWGIAPDFTIRDEDLEKLKLKIFDKNRIYLFQYLTGLTDPNGKTMNFLRSVGFSETEVKDFPGVGFIYVYDKK